MSINAKKYYLKIFKIFNNVKSIIYSMKEMRDWFYIKEIVKRTNENIILEKIIYCTSDSINLFRSILYNISTINLHNNNIKYISIFDNINNKKYIIYKQISPSYYYKYNNIEHNNIKNNIFNKINELDTIILKKEVIKKGGNLIKINKINEINLNKKKYIFKCCNMNYDKLRFELYEILNDLLVNVLIIVDDNSFYKDLKKNNFQESINFFNDFYITINKLHDFSKKYNLNILKYIDYNCINLCKDEINYINNYIDEDDNYEDNLQNYKDDILKIKTNLIDNIDKIKLDLLQSKFYYDSNYKLTTDEFNYTILLYYVVDSACELSQREKLGYVLKMLLNDYEYKLFRNAFNIFYDISIGYDDYIKGNFKFVKTFDEDKFDYITKVVYNEFYPDEYNNLPIEYFEKKNIVSKYDKIQEIIKKN